MTATDELRRMLDERGVKHLDGIIMTYTDDADYMPSASNTFDVTLYNLTPEQAIDATLGRGTCKVDSFADVQFIEDGKPESAYEYATLAECSACGAILLVPPSYIWYDEDSLYAATNYCPNCGREVTAGAQDDG